jgi:hypothetical protein
MPELDDVRLLGVDVSDTRWESLSRIKRLKGLTIHGGGSTDSGVAQFAESKAPLDGMSLEDVPIGDKAVAALGRLTTLRDIRLPGTNVSDAGLAGLKNLEQLEILHLLTARW